MKRSLVCALAVVAAVVPLASADFTRSILITGYWPPTNEMVRRFSQNPDQNPQGWMGRNWEGRGYNIYSYFPEFPFGLGRGVGTLEVDYQDTSEDWWPIVGAIRPVAIITFSRGSPAPQWEIELRQRNLATWVDDYDPPYQPTPAPPDGSVPANYVRLSSLPVNQIRDAVNAAGIGITAQIDNTGYGGAFLSEFIAYHGTWYKSLNNEPNGRWWCVAAGHIHVGTTVSVPQATQATYVSLRALIEYVNTQIPEPAPLTLLSMLALTLRRREPPIRAGGKRPS